MPSAPLRNMQVTLAACFLALAPARPALARPTLAPGVWTDITPAAPKVDPAANVFCQGMALDPSNPDVIYLCVCAFDVAKPVGLYKSVDGGSTWARVGALDEPVHVAVDPKDPLHLYAVDGVRGNTLGFWVSRDGGKTWDKPAGFVQASADPVGTQDLYSLATEPGNFDHVLISYHSPWKTGNNAGVLESPDGGATWTARNPPAGSAGGYGMAVFFLDYPQYGFGNAKTWLFTAQQGGFFRTTDGGATWSQVYNLQMTHGGNQIYCSVDGVLYSGGYQYPARSLDGGKSWAQVKTGLDYSWYIGIIGDGKTLYTAGSGTDRPFFSSPESDGETWTAYRGGAQTFSTQPFEMAYDSTNGIVYSSSWGGLYAMKVPPPGSGIRVPGGAAARARKPGLLPWEGGVAATRGTPARYSLRGRRLPGRR